MNPPQAITFYIFYVACGRGFLRKKYKEKRNLYKKMNVILGVSPQSGSSTDEETPNIHFLLKSSHQSLC
jgi:hypothetical protein